MMQSMPRPRSPIVAIAPLLLAASLVASPAAASVDGRLGALVDGASAVLVGTTRATGEHVTLDISEVLAGARDKPTLVLAATVPTDREFTSVGSGVPVPPGEELLVIVVADVTAVPHREFFFFRADTPQFRQAAVAVAAVDERGCRQGAIDLQTLAGASREDLVFLQREVFSLRGLSLPCRLDFLGIVLQRADASWQGDLFPAFSHDPVPGSAALWIEWLARHPIDAIPSERPEQLLQRLADPAAGPWLIQRLGYRRVQGDGLLAVLVALAVCDPVLGSCALTQVAREDPWPHAGHHRNEEIRTDLIAHLATLGVTPNPRCELAWSDYFALELPAEARDPLFMRSLDEHARHRLLMHLALYNPHDEALVAWLIRLGELEPGVRQQDEAYMAAARVLGRAPREGSTTAAALLEHLRRRAAKQHHGDIRGSLAAAGVLAARRTDVVEVLLAQYDAGDDAQQQWALRVLGETDVRLVEPWARQRAIELLIASNPAGEYRWLESAVLAHIERLTGEVYPVVHTMMEATDDPTRVRGLRWAAAASVRPDEMLPHYVRLYREDHPTVKAIALWAVGTVIGRDETYDRAAPLLDELFEDLHHRDEDVRQQARALLGQLVAKECASPGRWEGLARIVPALGEQLRSADDERRERIAGFLGSLRGDCVPAQLQRELR
jgi:hypothetical protein